jgi:flagellar motor switch protein FliN/FliY
MDILLDIELPVTLRFGRRQMSLEDILRLDTGSIIEFDRAVEDRVELLVNDRVVARGEAVTVQGHYGVRILEIAGSNPEERP